MAEKPNFDFSGYATKVGLKCSDGRIIQKDAFKHMNGQKVPLVWQHFHDGPANILGHATLEHREDGVYALGKFNETEPGKNAKELVRHGDITQLSIYANNLKQKGADVIHGMIREVSLVLSGANPGALIDNLNLEHGDGSFIRDEEEAIIYTGLPLLDDNAITHMTESDGERILHEELSSLTDDQRRRLSDRIKYMTDDQQMDVIMNTIRSMNDSQRLTIYKNVASNVAAHGNMTDALAHAAKTTYPEDATLQDIFDTLDETQKTMVYAMITQAIGGTDSEGIKHSITGGDNIVKTNIFDQTNQNTNKPTKAELLDAFGKIAKDAQKSGGSLKESFLTHAADYGIDNIEILFPEAQLTRNTPDIIAREDDWVSKFLNGTFKSPFSRVRSQAMDITAEEARAKGYITGKKKFEEVYNLLKRKTTPQTVYKKQKLDRDDIIDIIDFDVVMLLKAQQRRLLDEELARAALIGDGRPVGAEDKINPENIRPIYLDDELYAPKITLEKGRQPEQIIEDIVRARKKYKGSGSPNFYSTEDMITDLLLVKDMNQRRIYNTLAELASALRVNDIVAVDVMEGTSREIPGGTDTASLIGIIVNPKDYTMGADKGGQVTTFEDFDIDFNQHKYLIETRVSGALTKPKSALVIEMKD